MIDVEIIAIEPGNGSDRLLCAPAGWHDNGRDWTVHGWILDPSNSTPFATRLDSALKFCPRFRPIDVPRPTQIVRQGSATDRISDPYPPTIMRDEL